MPAIADPYSIRSRSVPVAEPALDDRGPSLKARVHVALHRTAVTRALAEGSDPGFGEELALCASRLTSRRGRRLVARSLRRAVAQAHRQPIGRYRGLIRRGAVLDAEDAIHAMIDRLGSPEPVRAQGMAMAEMILTNADHGPLYCSRAYSSLRDEITEATAALETDFTRSHEFPVGV